MWCTWPRETTTASTRPPTGEWPIAVTSLVSIQPPTPLKPPVYCTSCTVSTHYPASLQHLLYCIHSLPLISAAPPLRYPLTTPHRWCTSSTVIRHYPSSLVHLLYYIPSLPLISAPPPLLYPLTTPHLHLPSAVTPYCTSSPCCISSLSFPSTLCPCFCICFYLASR